MRVLVVFFSWSGNNRLLAGVLAARLAAASCEVVEAKRRSGFTIALDLLFHRKPAIRSIACSVAEQDHVVLVAPVWAVKIAHPMQTFLRQHGARLPAYSFISLCGNASEAQLSQIERQLTALTGKRPLQVLQLPLAECLPENRRKSPGAVTAYRATVGDTAHFESRLADFSAAIAGGNRRGKQE